MLQLGIFFSLYLVFPSFSQAQEKAADQSAYLFFDAQYGPDPDVFRGRKFISLLPYKSGSPYFGDERDGFIPFHSGSIVIKGQLVSEVQLAYDVYRQEVLIRSNIPSGRHTEIILPGELIDEFRIGEHHFIRNPYELIDGVFIEKIGGADAEILCFFSYHKEYRMQERAGKGEMGFGGLMSRKYIMADHTLNSFKGRKSFLKCLSKQDRQVSLSYIKSRPDRFRNADPAYFEALLEFIAKKESGDV